MILTACSEPPKKVQPKEPEKPAEPVAAQQAVQTMYVSARGWARDARILKLANLDVKDVKSDGGKAGAWECTFISQQDRRSRRFVYSAGASSGLTKGVSSAPAENWAPGGPTRDFALLDLKTDSTAAYETALKKSAAYVKQHPDMPMKYVVEWPKRFRNPVWRVIWGESISSSDYSVYVDAVTGEYVSTAR